MRRVILLLLTTVCLAACGSFSFTEEVKLASGEVIVVKRTVKAKALGEIGGPGGWKNQGMTLEILTPKKPGNPPVWNQTLVPLLFDRDDKTGEWFLVATFYTCEEAPDDAGLLKLPYYEFRVKNGQWVRSAALTPALIGREGNVFTGMRSSGEPNHTLQSKKEIDRNSLAAPEYLRIVDKWRNPCPPPGVIQR